MKGEFRTMVVDVMIFGVVFHVTVEERYNVSEINNVWFPIGEFHAMGLASKLGVRDLRKYLDLLIGHTGLAWQMECTNTFNEMAAAVSHSPGRVGGIKPVVTIDERKEGFTNYIVGKLIAECEDTEVKALLLEMTKPIVGLDRDEMIL